MIISLIGYRATGKTTVASLLAERLAWHFVDTDAQIQQQVGRSISSIFEQLGEQAFRDYEAKVIADVMRKHKMVVSLGGGAILREENRQAISVAGPVVWLAASTETICQRLKLDPATEGQRPSLTGRPPEEEVNEVLNERLPIYQELADHTIATDGMTPREIVDAILAELDLASQLPLQS